MKKNLVSAIITTKNRSGMLPRALASVKKQTYPNLELVVVDDGSEDNTPSILKDFVYEQNFISIRNEQSRGACKARNQGIGAANGEFIAGLDDDDEWDPYRIQSLMQAYGDEFSCITSNVRLVYPKRSVLWKKDNIITYNDLLFSNQVGNQVLVRKDRLLKVGAFDENLVAAQDYDLWLRLTKAYGPVKNVQRTLQNVYLDHESEQITNPKTQLAGYLYFYQKHKSEMNYAQRKYQLFNIRRAQGKVAGLLDILTWVPFERYPKDIKRWISEVLWK